MLPRICCFNFIKTVGDQYTISYTSELEFPYLYLKAKETLDTVFNLTQINEIQKHSYTMKQTSTNR